MRKQTPPILSRFPKVPDDAGSSCRDKPVTADNPSTMDHHPFSRLQPELILDAVENLGFTTNGRILALNSYENRVYQIGVDDFGGTPVVVKFYRPQRWTDAAILEEHHYTRTLADHEIPVAAPLAPRDNQTLYEYDGFRYAVYLSRGGRWPPLDRPEHLRWIGRFLGRIHAVGATKRFQHRPVLKPQTFGHDALAVLMKSDFVPGELRQRFDDAGQTALSRVEETFARLGDLPAIRLHGDCHPGNILWTDAGPHFVDFDDCLSGPAIQDLWMLLAGDRDEMTVQIAHLVAGYNEFYPFPPAQLALIEPLRTLRLIHYSAWLVRRWSDPAFPQTFPWFAESRYWHEQIAAIEEQITAMTLPALALLSPDDL